MKSFWRGWQGVAWASIGLGVMIWMVLGGGAKHIAAASELVDAEMTIQLTDLSEGGVVLKKGILSTAQIENLTSGLANVELRIAMVMNCSGSFSALKTFLNYGDPVNAAADIDLDSGIIRNGVVLSRRGCRCSIDISTEYAQMLEDGIASVELIIGDALQQDGHISLASIRSVNLEVRGVRRN